MKDEDRAEAVLKAALASVENAFVPMEVIMLTMLLDERIDPYDAVIAAYLLGKCRGDVRKLPVSAPPTPLHR